MANPSISLGVYFVHFGPRAVNDPLGSVLGQHDALDLVHQYLQSRHSAYQHDAEEAELLSVDQFQIANRVIDGVVKSGRYGASAEIVNSETLNLEFPVQRLHATVRPFYFQFFLPEHSANGILMIQRTGIEGISGVLYKDMRQWFNDNYQGFHYRVASMVPADVVRSMAKGSLISKIRFIRHSLSADIVDHLDNADAQQTDGRMEFVVSAKRGFLFDLGSRIQAIIDGSSNAFQLLQLPGNPFVPEKVQIDVRIGDHSRVIDLGSFELARPFFPISPGIDATSGHPIVDEVREAATTLRAHFEPLLAVSQV
jgi:hypothetical protein